MMLHSLLMEAKMHGLRLYKYIYEHANYKYVRGSL